MSRLSRALPWMAIGMLAAAGFGHAGRLHAATPRAPDAQAVTSAVSATTSRALLNDYCVICHNERLKTAGLMLDKADVQQMGAGAEVWEKVVKKIRSGAMPPAGRQRPDKPTFEAFVTWVETELD